MQVDVGLHSYTPTVPGGSRGSPTRFRTRQPFCSGSRRQTYWNGFTTLAVRTYTLTHDGVYLTTDGQSRADFPVSVRRNTVPDQPVISFDQPADWMHGPSTHLVAARPAAVDGDVFATSGRALGEIAASVPLDGAIACIGEDYVTYWELSPSAPGAKQGPVGDPPSSTRF